MSSDAPFPEGAGPWWRVPRRTARRVGTVLLAVSLLLLAGLVSPVRAEAVTLVPVADSYVDEERPDRANGSAEFLRVDGSPLRTSYLRFDLGDAAGLTSALLRLRTESDNTDTTGVEVRVVDDDTWSEATVTATTAPPVGRVLDTTGPTKAGASYDLDVSGALDGDRLVSLALTTPSSTAVKLTSREGAVPPQLMVPAPDRDTRFEVRPYGSKYLAAGNNGTSHTGRLKSVVERAVEDLRHAGGGTVAFTAGDFDLGNEYLKFYSVRDIVFEGAGMDATHVHNESGAADDTEPFNFTGADHIVVRDLTVTAGGPARTTSDALDFDNGDDNTIERVRVAGSRGRGIVFDGKNDDWTADRNTVRDCVITGVPSKGIELLASRHNRVEGCTITSTGGIGIQANKSSGSADQPHKTSSDNVISGNTVLLAGGDGIQVNSGSRNQVVGNTVRDSSTTTTGRDGIRIVVADGVPAEDNVVTDNTVTDGRLTPRQNYGLNIASSECLRTVHGRNAMEGNRLGPLRDAGQESIPL